MPGPIWSEVDKGHDAVPREVHAYVTKIAAS